MKPRNEEAAMKPSDFFVGAMDFFSILMPGALLAFLLTPWAPGVFGPVLPALESEGVRWVAFAVAAYFFGHLLHHLSSWLDEWYDQTYVAEKRRFGDEKLLVRARELTKADLGDNLEDVSIFMWAGSYVRANNSAAAAELERAGGDSKFFRSLCLVSILAVALCVFRGNALAAACAAALTVFSYRRFCKQRWESSRRTYEYFVLLRSQTAGAANRGNSAGVEVVETGRS